MSVNVWESDGITSILVSSVADKAAAVLITPTLGSLMYIRSADGRGNLWRAVVGASAGTYSDDGGSFCGTVFIPTGGDGSSAWVRDYLGKIDPAWYGLSGTVNLYVRKNGNDSNTGFINSAVGAFLTIQKAVDELLDNILIEDNDATINVGDGTYTDGVIVNGTWQGSGLVTLLGNSSTPANCIISTTSEDCIAAKNNARLTVNGFKLLTATSGNCINALLGSNVTLFFMEYGACANTHINVGQNSYIGVKSDYLISGSAVSHWHAGTPSIIFVDPIAITLTGTPAFSAYFAGTASGYIDCRFATFSGTASGRRFFSHKGGLIDCDGNTLTYLPGDVDGYLGTLGVYTGDGAPVEVKPNNAGGVVSGEEVLISSWHWGNQAAETRFKTTSGNFGGQGFFYTNGDDCYSSGLTHFGSEAEVAVTSGTEDGFTFNKKSLVDIGFVVFNGSADGTSVGRLRRRTSDGGILDFYRDTTGVGSISVTATNTSYNTTSDYRLKENIKPMVDAINSLMLLNPSKFNFISTPDKTQAGFIAHELHGVIPEAVTGDKDGEEYQQVDYSKVVPLLTAALQEAIDRIKVLESKV